MNFLVLDGGLASELSRAGFCIDDDALWSARVLVENPEAIRTVHKSFLESGADVLITATYQTSIKGLVEHCGLSESKSLAVIQKGVEIAQDICHEFYSASPSSHQKPLVAGSVGPYGACRHDGSEYTGKYVEKITVQELIDWHRPRVAALVQGGVDLLAFETIPAQKEAEALVCLLKEFPDTKAWLSFSCQDGTHTCHGERFSDAVSAAVFHSTQIAAVGMNCTSPLFVKSITGNVSLPYVVYPNSGEEWKNGKWHDATAVKPLYHYVEEWIEVGARWIGGCCRTQPKDIAKIREIVEQPRAYSITLQESAW